MSSAIRIGCAGWSLPKDQQHAFGEGASHLERYATRFGATEINSTFYRPHASGVFARWAGSVPESFAFSAKLPRTITHDRRLVDCDAELGAFLAQVAPLGKRLRCLLVQLPPSLAFDDAAARHFLGGLRRRWPMSIAMEPRHESWFTKDVDDLLADLRIARVLADPVRHDAGRWPGGWQQLVYLRLHGSPRMYYSAYEPKLLESLAARIRAAAMEGREVWCIFDNTASGAATGDALGLMEEIDRA